MIERVFICTIVLLFSSTLMAGDVDIEQLFKKEGVEGTLLIESLNGDVQYTNNAAEAELRHIPASTFKIPNTLIALEEGVVKDPFEIIAWDGVERQYAPWNADQTLATAFARSCVWCYQRFAKQVGDTRYQHYLDAFDYGNKKTGLDVETFWLDGELGVSPREQINFLRNVYFERLPVKTRNIKILKEIMRVDETPAYTLRAKTGWKGLNGWYVGYVEAAGEVWFFAHHMIINDKRELPLRRKLVIDALAQKGII